MIEFIRQVDMMGYALYTAWREEQLIKAIRDHLEDPEMETLCIQEWPWDAMVGNG
jgi:hypothetical protein